MTYGIAMVRDVMVRTRDGVGLATDVYRPARDADWANERVPTLLCRTPYNKSDTRFSAIADFFVPHGYAVCLQDVRDRYSSEGTGEYFHTATPHEGEDGYDTIEWIAAQSWSNGRVGMAGSSYAALTQVRAALERPPHLTAIWPDVAPANAYHHGKREGGAMQLQMLWGLLVHAQDAQDIAEDVDKQSEVWTDFKNLRSLLWAFPFSRGQLSLRHTPTLEQALIDYTTRGAYDEYWAQKTNDYTRYYDEHADIPATITTGWFDLFPHADTDYFVAMASQNSSPQRLIVGPWTHAGMRGDASHSNDVEFGQDAAWGVQRYFEEQLRFFDRHLKDSGTPPEDGPVRIFVMGGGSGAKTATGKLYHGGHWRSEREWPLARASYEMWHLGCDGTLSPEPPAEQAPRRYTYDPARPIPTIGGSYLPISELPTEDGTDASREQLISPMLRLRSLLIPGPADQREAPEIFASREPYPRLSERPDVLVYQSAPLTDPIELTGRVEVHLQIMSSAPDTDFTAKLIDVHPPTDAYPDGYDMLLCDSIIRCRYRNGFDHEDLMQPGTPYDITIHLPPTSNQYVVGHRIRIDVSSSNFPRFDRNPNTGEPVGRHTHMVSAEQTVVRGRVTFPVVGS